jgi:hypothetical protein
MPIYDFDLDLPPGKRWEKIFNENQHKLNSVKIKIKNILDSIGYNTINKITKPLILTMKFFNKLYYVDEISYIADRMGMNFDEILVLQLIYECSSACTSAVLNINGDDLFVRTMDWPMDFLKQMTIQLNIKKNGIAIAQGITWIGYVGLLTAMTASNDYSGMASNAFGISINYRKTQDITLGTIIKNAFRTFNMKWPVGYLVRDIIEKNMGRTRAIKTLSDAHLISPCYITVFSPGNSKMITRDANAFVSIRDINLVQTNCDYDKTEPNILWSCERRNLMKKIETELNNGDDNTITDMLKKILIFPIQNDETIYVYAYYKGKYEAYILN